MKLLAIGLVVVTLGMGDFVAADEASIEGWVVNESHDPVPCAGAKAVLRVRIGGQFVPVEEATADSSGRFVFDQLPVGDEILYLPGANFGGVHYPGPRVQLSAEQPHARVKLVVFDSATDPSPLLAERHHILVEPDSGVLRITESIIVKNPTSKCYVGRGEREGAEPITLRLAIPEDFQRATFHKEFLGRQFSMRQDDLVTAMPWPPGKRELGLTYVIANDERQRVVQRELDLACSRVRLTVRTDTPHAVTCNLSATPDIQEGQVCFESEGATLPAGHVIRLEMGQLPVSLIVYARWVAVAVLLGLMAGVAYRTRQRGRNSVELSARANGLRRDKGVSKSRKCAMG